MGWSGAGPVPLGVVRCEHCFLAGSTAPDINDSSQERQANSLIRRSSPCADPVRSSPGLRLISFDYYKHYAMLARAEFCLSQCVRCSATSA
jgi:hypothetical protein